MHIMKSSGLLLRLSDVFFKYNGFFRGKTDEPITNISPECKALCLSRKTMPYNYDKSQATKDIGKYLINDSF